MRTKAREAATRTSRDGQGATVSAIAQLEHPGVLPTSEALIAFAEEFGRLLARQLLTDPSRRRGYGLLLGLYGLIVMAVLFLFVVQVLRLLQH